MSRDPAVDEIRAVRHKISAQFGHDTKAMLTHYKELEARYQSRMLKEGPAGYTMEAGEVLVSHCQP